MRLCAQKARQAKQKQTGVQINVPKRRKRSTKRHATEEPKVRPTRANMNPKMVPTWPKLASCEVHETYVGVHRAKLRYRRRFWTPC